MDELTVTIPLNEYRHLLHCKEILHLIRSDIDRNIEKKWYCLIDESYVLRLLNYEKPKVNEPTSEGIVLA